MKRIFIFLFISIVVNTFSQQVSPEIIATAGDHFENEDISLSWTIGEPVISTFSGEYILTQGFHQEMYIITSIDEIKTNLNISIYPNPTPDMIHITTNESLQGKLEIQLLDFKGSLITEKKFDMNLGEASINLDSYERANYILKVKLNEEVRTFKILKM